MAFVYVEDIPSDIDMANKYLIQSGSAKMLLDFSTGYIYATNMTWDSPPGRTQLTFKEQDLRDLFYGLNGQTLEELSNSGKLAKINDFIRTRRDELILKKRGGRHDMAGTQIIKSAIANGTYVKYHNEFFQIINSTYALSQWIYTIDIPKKGTMYEHLDFRGPDMPPSTGEFIYVGEDSLRLSPEGKTYILHDDLSTIFKTYGISALYTMTAGLVSNFALNIWQGTTSYMSGLTALPMLVGNVAQRSWNLPWNWSRYRVVADATRIVGGPGGPLMHRFGQTAYGFTRIGGAYALPAIAVAFTLAWNVNLWNNNALRVWESAKPAAKKTVEVITAVPVVVAETLGKTVGGFLWGVGDGIGMNTLSGGTMTVGAVVAALLLLAAFKATD